MWFHRDDLINRLDHDGLEHFKRHQPRIYGRGIQCREMASVYLKRRLLRADGGAMKNLTRAPSKSILFNQRTNPCGCAREPSLPSLALCLFRVRD